MEKNTELLSKALRLLPEVKNTVVHPNEGQEYSKPLGKGDSVRIDFGRHLVGHLKLMDMFGMGTAGTGSCGCCSRRL